jgi:hypothetical protein
MAIAIGTASSMGRIVNNENSGTERDGFELLFLSLNWIENLFSNNRSVKNYQNYLSTKKYLAIG